MYFIIKYDMKLKINTLKYKINDDSLTLVLISANCKMKYELKCVTL